jgi:hypothetical protein
MTRGSSPRAFIFFVVNDATASGSKPSNASRMSGHFFSTIAHDMPDWKTTFDMTSR